MAKFCTSCGSPLPEGAKFCTKCGAAISASAQPQAPRAAAPETGSPEPGGGAAARAASSLRDPISAPTLPGETGFELPSALGAVGKAAEAALPTPLKVLGNGLRERIDGIKRLGRDKKALLGAAVTLAVWLGIWLWNRFGGENPVARVLSALTFAEGGTKGTPLQLLGGICGKGLVLSGYASLFAGGFSGLLGGAKRLFGKGLDLCTAVLGLGLAMSCYQLLAGFTGTYGIAVAVSGAVLSLEALGGSLGLMGELARSLLVQKAGGLRLPDDNRLNSLFTGAAAGFALSAALSALYIPWWLGLVLALGAAAVSLVLGRTAKGKAVAQ